jgi:hypothetical protein
MDSETGFLFSHAIASGKKEEELAKIVDSYGEYQKICKAFNKATAKLGNTDVVFCNVAIGKYLDLEKKLRSLLGEDFSKAIKAYKSISESQLKIKDAVNGSGLSKEEIKDIFPMLQEFI